MKQQLLDRIRNKTATLGIVGLGYVGLPLAVEFARAGLQVIGIELDERKVAAIARGESYIPDIPTPVVADLVKQGRLMATTSYAELRHADAVSICVPTPLRKTRDPDMSYVVNAAEGVAEVCHPGLLIVLESTTYPGTTEEILQPKLEAKGFHLGEDVFLAFSPERIDPGNTRYGVRNTPKVIGGATSACTEVATALYRLAVDTIVPVSSMRAAEMVKLLENTFRAVNIGLVNEMALMCAKLEVDVWEVIEAAATKPYGFMKFTPGPGIGGHCLNADEFIFVRNGSDAQMMQIGELASHLKAKSDTRSVRNQDDVLLIAPPNLEILSFDPRCRETCFKPVRFVSQRRYEGPMVQVWTTDGRRLTVTDGHPLMIWDGSEFRRRPASDLRPGNELIIPLGQAALDQEVSPVDLIPYLQTTDIERMRAKPEAARYEDYDSILRPHLGPLGLSRRDVYRQNAMPLAAYLALEQKGRMPIPREAIRLATGRGPSYNSFPAVIHLNEDFARLLGYYLSEGCLTEDKSLRVRFTFNLDERQTISDLTAILKRLGLRYSTYRDRQWHSFHINVSSRPFALLLRDVLQCGRNSLSMQAPAVLMTAPEAIRRALLTGLLRGDGDVHHAEAERLYRKRGKSFRHHFNTCTVGYFSSSSILFQQVVLLLHGLGFVPTFKRNKPQLRLYGAAQLERLTPLFLDIKRERLEKYRQARRKSMPLKQSKLQAGFATVQVREVAPAPPVENVYSVEVEDTHTFITSFGLLVHNCIPIDPLYLSWKLKSLNYTARFIELADSINSFMPEHVVTLIADALNEEGKALRGSKILVLGAAYKKDLDDVRESPALDVMAELLTRKAQVSYHDPFVPAIKLDQFNLQSAPLSATALREADCVLVITDHSVFDWELIGREARLIVDTRNVVKESSFGVRVVKL